MKYRKYLLGSGFETIEQAVSLRKNLKSGIRSLQDPRLRKYLRMGSCSRDEPCESGLCPICVRRFRRRLVKFAEKKQLHKLNWYMVTIAVDQWKMEPGDFRSFSAFMDEPGTYPAEIRAIKAFKQQLKRIHAKRNSLNEQKDALRVIGSIETQYDQVSNRPNGKPFHIHLLISGLNKDDIRDCAEAFLKENSENSRGRKIDIRSVKSGFDDFAQALTYCAKQPFQKKVFINEETGHPRRVWAKPSELAELAANISKIPVNGRLILIGLRYNKKYIALL